MLRQERLSLLLFSERLSVNLLKLDCDKKPPSTQDICISFGVCLLSIVRVATSFANSKRTEPDTDSKATNCCTTSLCTCLCPCECRCIENIDNCLEWIQLQLDLSRTIEVTHWNRHPGVDRVFRLWGGSQYCWMAPQSKQCPKARSHTDNI